MKLLSPHIMDQFCTTTNEFCNCYKQASNKNEYQEYFLGGKGGWCFGMTTSLPSCNNCHKMWKRQPPGTLKACPGLYRYCFTFTFMSHLYTPVLSSVNTVVFCLEQNRYWLPDTFICFVFLTYFS